MMGIAALWRRLGTRYLTVGGAVFAAALLFATVEQRVRGDGLVLADELEYAQMARRLAFGRGFTTGWVCPLSLTFAPDVFDHPNLWRPPGFVALLAGFDRLLGPSEHTAHAAVHLVHAATVAGIAVIVQRAAGGILALLAAIAFVVNPDVRLFRLVAMTETQAGFLFLVLLVCLQRRAPALLSGAVLGALSLVRGEAITFLPWIAWAEFIVGRRWQRAAAATVGCLLVVSPWWARNYSLTGDPFFNLHQRVFVTQPFAYALDSPQACNFSKYKRLGPLERPAPSTSKLEVLGPYLSRVVRTWYRSLPIAADPWPFVLVLAGLFWTGLAAAPRPVVLLLALLPVSHAFLLAALLCPITPRLGFVFLPACYAYGFAALGRMLAGSGRRALLRAGAASVAAALIVAWPMAVNIPVPAIEQLGMRKGAFGRWWRPLSVNAPQPSSVLMLYRLVPPGAPIASDIPYTTAWYADRSTVWLPLDDAELERVERLVGPIPYIYVAADPGGTMSQNFARRFEATKLPDGAVLLRRRSEELPRPPFLDSTPARLR